ncbi:SAM-dependent methyltransferase [Penaeicola halotolerans]|uniref:SAM-dependent methyltransferase n=1 Tax=Penaeicola halotolerans TaxID=2793196 RepID=UPI001CF812CE|nr:SAM-dependent methyltransferase [Penaeicola halotolerans]
MSQTGILYLIPSNLAEDTADQVINEQVRAVIKETKYYLVENLRTARRYIGSLKTGVVIDELHFEILDKKTTPAEVAKLMGPALQGQPIGVISEAGCPGVADPGALAVAFAHQKGIKVCPLVGPSSFLLALMASGFNGQSFTFHGYIPIQKKERIDFIKQMERHAQKKQTQLFMETPFRNNHLLEDILQHCQPDTLLCIAKNITGADEMIQTKSIKDWRKAKPDLHKVPTVFLLY